MAGLGRKLGAAFVELFADKRRLESDLQSAKTTVTQATEEMSDAGKQTASSMASIGEQLKESTKPARTLLQGLLSIKAVAFGIVGVIGAIGSAIGLAVVVAVKLKDAILGSKAEAEELKKKVDDIERAWQGTNAAIREQIRMQAEARGEPSPDIVSEDAAGKAKQTLIELDAQIEKMDEKVKNLAVRVNTSEFWGPLFLTDDLKRAQTELEKLNALRERLLAQIESTNATAREREHAAELDRISKETKARIDGILAESKARREAATDREFEQMLRDGLRSLYEQQQKEQAAIAAEKMAQQQAEHAKRMSDYETEHRNALRLQAEFWNNMLKKFSALDGLIGLRALPKAIRDSERV